MALPDPELSGRVHRMLDGILEAERAALLHAIEEALDEGIPPDVEPELSVHCRIGFVSIDFLSVLCTNYWYVGGAHPTKGAVAYNMELPSMREVQLSELFVPGTDWGTALAARVQRERAEVMGVDESPRLDAGGLRFVVTGAGLRFLFEDEAPYASGSVHPLVPWAELAPYLRASGPVAAVRACTLQMGAEDER